MLGKLIKYEWKGFCLPLLIMIIVLTVTTALTSSIILTINPNSNEVSAAFSMLSLWLILLMYYVSIIGCSLGITLVIVVRFYKTCYTDQGYLTHTLPVSAQKILNVKIASSAVVSMLMTIATVTSVFVILNLGVNRIVSIFAGESYYGYQGGNVLLNVFTTLFSEFKDEFGISFGWYIAYLIVYFIIAIIANTTTILGCVSLGQLYAKHRIIGAIIAYFVIQFIMSVLGNISTILTYSRMFGNSAQSKNFSALRSMTPNMNLTLLFLVVMAVAMYFINLHMMTKRLNLE